MRLGSVMAKLHASSRLLDRDGEEARGVRNLLLKSHVVSSVGQ